MIESQLWHHYLTLLWGWLIAWNISHIDIFTHALYVFSIVQIGYNEYDLSEIITQYKKKKTVTCQIIEIRNFLLYVIYFQMHTTDLNKN